MADINRKRISKLFENYHDDYSCNEISWGNDVGDEIFADISENISEKNINPAICAMQLIQNELEGKASEVGIFSDEDVNKLVNDIRHSDKSMEEF